MSDDVQKSWESQTVPIEKVLEVLSQHLGATSEIVYHDLTMPYDHTIVYIQNGEITGRAIGGCGSNIGLEVMRGTVKDGDRFNYITHTKSGKILRSSSIYLYDRDKVKAALCINTDISDTVRMESLLKAHNSNYLDQGRQSEKVEENFALNVGELLDQFMKDAQRLVGTPSPMMNKEEKLRFLRYLDHKGAFLISKSGEHVCAFLGISKYTLYNYLEEIRNEPLRDAHAAASQQG